MKNTAKRFLALALVLVMVCGMLPAHALAAETGSERKAADVGPLYVSHVNPLYADVVTEELAAPAQANVMPLSEEEYTTDVNVLGEALRAAMEARQESVVVYYQMLASDFSQEEFDAVTADAFDIAVAHTGVPTQGDYLRWQYQQWGAGSDGITADSTYYYLPITFTLSYYTTAAQEAEMDSAAEEVRIAAESYETDYEKLKWFYDWMCDNITYDYDNLYNTSYKLKYTAYAAMFNRTAVCQGFANLLYRMALEMGIDCRMVPGDTDGDGENDHAWNIVKLDDKWYNADATWDINYKTNDNYVYFLRNDANFAGHTRDAAYATETFYAAYPMGETDYDPTTAGDEAEIEKTVLDVVTAQYGYQTADWWAQFEQDFEAANENVDLVVDCLSWNDIYSEVESRLDSSTAPDILNIDSFESYQDKLLPVQDYMSEATYAKFYEDFLAQSEVDGTVWAVPDLASARGLYYNQDILDAAGVSVPTTWAELVEACAAIAAVYGDTVYPWGMDMTANEGQAAFALYTWANGGGFVDADGNWALNSAGNVEAVEFAVALSKEGYTTSADATRYDIQDLFAQGQVAMMIAPDSFAFALENVNYGVAALPFNAGQAAYTIGVMDRMMCFDNGYTAEELAAITAFFDFFYDDARYAGWTQMEGFLPATSTGMELIAAEDTSKAAWVEILDYCKFYPTNKAEWSSVRNGVIDVLAQALAGGDVQALLDTLQADVTGVPTGPAEVASGIYGDNLTWTLTEDGMLTISGNGEMAQGIHPWYQYADQIKTAVVKEGITTLSNGAFMETINMTSVTLPDSLTTIDGFTFAGSGLTSIDIPDGVTAIEKETFSSCFNLTAVYGCSNITSIGESAFAYCSSLVKIELGNKLTTIENSAFANCSKLNDIILPDTVTTIGDFAFSGCSSLAQLILPDTLENLGEYAFETSGLTSITIPNSLTEIKIYTFYGCRNLREITFGNSALQIGPYAFACCDGLTRLVIPDNVIALRSNAFRECDNLSDVTIGAGVGDIGWSAFYGCDNLSGVEIREGVTNIEPQAFMSCNRLTSITIPSSIQSIGEFAFSSDDDGVASALTEIRFIGNAPAFSSDTFSNIKATAYYPAGNATWTADVMQDYGGTITWKARYEVFDDSDTEAALGETLAVHVDAEMQKLQDVYMDGEPVSAEYYTVTDGSTIITFHEDYLASLSTGEHVVTIEFADGTAETTIKVDSGVTYKTASISLAGDIGLNYYAVLSAELAAEEGTYMVFTLGTETQTVPLSEAVVSTDASGVTTHRFSCAVPAKRMTDTVTGQLYTSEGKAVGEAKEYSVKAYCDAAIPVYGQYAAYADLVALMEAMLNYGGYSQVQFAHNTGNLANADLADTTLPEITAADVEAYAHGAEGSEEGISVSTVSLLLESTTTIRFYFTLADGYSISDYTFYVDGVEVEPTLAEGKYYVDKVNVAAKDLDEMATVTVGGLTVRYCGLSYVRQATVLYPTYYSEDLVNVAKALYVYNQAANAYFE